MKNPENPNSSLLLKTLDTPWGVYRGDELVFQRPLACIFLAYIVLEKRYQRSHLASFFGKQTESRDTQLKSLSDILRQLRKLEIIRDNEEFTEIYVDIECDALDFTKHYQQENFKHSISHYRSFFFKGLESKQVLHLDERPELYDWLLNKQDEFASMYLESQLGFAEFSIRQGRFDYVDQLWKFYCDYDKSSFIYEDYQRFIALFKTAKDRRHIKILNDAEKQGFKSHEVIHPLHPLAHNLPSLPSEVIAREKEIEHLKALLSEPTQRTISIIGQSGVGKSYLAIELAKQLLGKKMCRDGNYWIDLRQLRSPEHLITALAKLLDLPNTIVSLDDLSRHIHNRSMLFTLDNAEHLLQIAPIMNTLLQHCPNIKFIVATQARLGFNWEHCYWLYGLDTAHHPMQIKDLSSPQYPAFCLFYTTAKRLNGSIQFKEEDLPHIIQICKSLEGLPLAINLVTSWLLTHSCQHIAEKLYDQNYFRLEQSTDIGKYLYTSLEYSWDLLPEDEQLALISLGVFVNGFQQDAAIKITHIQERHLRSLVEKSLLLKSDSFHFHPLIYQFCIDKLNLHSELKETLEKKHAYYYLGGNEATFWNLKEEQIPKERSNIYKACYWAMQHESIELLLQMLYLITLGDFLKDQQETIYFLNHLEHSFPEASDITTIVRKSFEINFHYYFGDRERAITIGHEILAIVDRNSWLVYLQPSSDKKYKLITNTYTTAYNAIAWSELLIGHYEKAETTFYSMLERPHIFQGITRAFMAYAQCYQGKFTEAFDNLQQSLKDVMKEEGLGWSYFYILVSMGILEWQMGKPKEAEQRLRKLIKDYDNPIEHKRTLLAARAYLAEALLAQGKLPQAREVAQNLLHILQSFYWVDMILQSKLVLGSIFLLEGKYEEAKVEFADIAKEAHKQQLHMAMYRALIGLCDSLHHLKDPRASALQEYLNMNRHLMAFYDAQWFDTLQAHWVTKASHKNNINPFDLSSIGQLVSESPLNLN